VLCRTYVVRLGSEQILGTPISSRASKALAVPVLFLVYSFLSYQTFGLGALGSGVLPVPLHVSFLWVLPAILVFSVIGGILWNRRGCLINTALGIIVLLLILEITRHCFLTGLHHAQTYGKALASSIQLFHKVHSRWPSSLDELPKDLLPAFDPESISPYLCFKNNDYFDKIGGFFIQYDVEKGSPRLRVGRRKVVFSWNWDESVWERKMY
jgi:hypothetical protein